MRFVNDDGKIATFVFASDAVDDNRKLMYGCYYDLLASVYGITEIAGMFSPCNSIRYLHELFNSVANLLIQNNAVGYNKNGIHDVASVCLFKTDELVGKPSN